MGDSNVDLGQDLSSLKKYLTRNRFEDPVYFAYFGSMDPSVYGLPVTIVENAQDIQGRGILAISAARMTTWTPKAFSSLVKGKKPFAQLGNSILFFRVNETDRINQRQ
jgi:hypothetical protein